MAMGDDIKDILRIVSKIEPMVDDHHNTLYGNGQPGLAKQVIILEETQKNCKARTNSSRLNYMALLRTIGIVIAVVSAVIALIKST